VVNLPPTSAALLDDTTRPYFLWWTTATVGDLRAHLASDDPSSRGYWLGALLREANSRDVWLFTTPEAIREAWPFVVPHLGRQRAMWAWLLGLPEPEWPPRAAHDGSANIVRDGGMHVRAELSIGATKLRMDVVHEHQVDLAPADEVEGVAVESFADLRASKLTCLLSRSEPRDLVDVLFLERAGHPPERDLEAALKKDAGIDPGVLAWLLSRFRVEPLPQMLVPLDAVELRAYRDSLAERLRVLAGRP
jgi:hypothetical protein